MIDPNKPIAAAYSVQYLLNHPTTRPILLEHLLPTGVTKEQLENIQGTFVNMLERALRDHLPSQNIMELMEILNDLPREKDL